MRDAITTMAFLVQDLDNTPVDDNWGRHAVPEVVEAKRSCPFATTQPFTAEAKSSAQVSLQTLAAQMVLHLECPDPLLKKSVTAPARARACACDRMHRETPRRLASWTKRHPPQDLASGRVRRRDAAHSRIRRAFSWFRCSSSERMHLNALEKGRARLAVLREA